MSFISDHYLPVIFLGLMGFAMLLYAILDGYDLGTGILLLGRSEQHRDEMIASIGPFWDANETWLVLGVGILLVAFPAAHGIILSTLYVPVAVMLAGLIIRGVSFDFRAKAQAKHKQLWDSAFFAGSLLATLSQGYMLGLYITGFSDTGIAVSFAMLSALCVTSAYVLIGACWLVLKTTGDLQQYAIQKAKSTVVITAIGLLRTAASSYCITAFLSLSHTGVYAKAAWRIRGKTVCDDCGNLRTCLFGVSVQLLPDDCARPTKRLGCE